jgi:hypothetical protein
MKNLSEENKMNTPMRYYLIIDRRTKKTINVTKGSTNLSEPYSRNIPITKLEYERYSKESRN